MTTSQISAAYLRGLIDCLRLRNIDTECFLERYAVDQALVENFQARLPVERFNQMLYEAETLTGDEDIGLHVGEQIKPNQYGVLGLSIMNCKNLEEAVKRHTRYENLVCNVAMSRYQVKGDQVELTWDTCAPEVTRHIAEENVASWITFARWISGTDLSPSLIQFQHNKPNSIEEHERIFRCPLKFSAERVRVLFPAEYLQLSLRQYDPAMLAMLDTYAERLLLELNSSGRLVDQVTASISTHLQSGEVSLGHIAATLGLSERQLQRKLKEEGLTYQGILDNTRKTLALKQIEDGMVDLYEITFLLGFSDQSAFQRAFKKWTGMTPGQYRKTSNPSLSTKQSGI
ncbi:AraC family transcriptional regulator [Alkalimarinus sediminis]|uniref:AraC family transcriptional regulator n=1 Tax=Alkalimarinus sediminis TaxID=1632866 RepID=A0A9E8HLA1_9ALTE|nr:AraC family transcriptional regulator [Alkalimarinus sediminis]UZW74941.1 AraC family transcriptional regulator [Alkalimarinus sediminis]